MLYNVTMTWQVGLNGKAAKQAKKLPKNVADLLKTLRAEIMVSGPIRGNWPNYSKLGPHEHHCHLTYKYVACWREKDKKIHIVEVYYVGSREKAPY